MIPHGSQSTWRCAVSLTPAIICCRLSAHRAAGGRRRKQRWRAPAHCPPWLYKYLFKERSDLPASVVPFKWHSPHRAYACSPSPGGAGMEERQGLGELQALVTARRGRNACPGQGLHAVGHMD